MRIEQRFRAHQPLSELTTFGIGGPARLYLEAKTSEDVEEALLWAKTHGAKFFVLGKGSNSLFPKEGFDGLLIHNKIDFCQIKETLVETGAGFSFSLLGIRSAKLGLSGLEFASGIPGAVGGAIFMNAGANGKETSETLQEVLFLHAGGTLQRYLKEEMVFSYRTSPFHHLEGCILSAKFHLSARLEARKEQLAIIDYRLKTQPYKDKSAGCIFRNPSKELPAGMLIDQCGLKGLACGGAKVSEKHANFIVNTGAADASEVLSLIAKIQQTVFAKTGIHLEPEVRVIS